MLQAFNQTMKCQSLKKKVSLIGPKETPNYIQNDNVYNILPLQVVTSLQE